MTWSQLTTILWLRWRLTRNQWSRHSGRKLAAALTIIGAIVAICLAVAMGIGGVVGGAVGLSVAEPRLVLVIWDAIAAGFLFIWMIGVLTEIQRSESIDLPRLLHLPISLKGVFVVNYIGSHLALSLIIFLPGMLGACLGMIWGKGWTMIFLIPLVLSFIFQLTAWTYCLRGWLVALMVNPRRRRTVMVGVTMTAVLIGQLPNLYFNVYLRRTGAYSRHFQYASGESSISGALEKLPPGYLAAHHYVPFLWLPNGAMALQNGNVWPAILGSLGASLVGVAGLARAYRSTIRFYQGAETARPAKTAAVAVAAAPDYRRKKLLERTLPWTSEETSALTFAYIRSLSRAPEAKMAMLSNIIIVAIVMVSGVTRLPIATSKLGQVFVVPAAIGIVFFAMVQWMLNQFGSDRDGFRALVLLPASRRRVLLAKNLSLAPIVLGIGTAMLAGLEIVGHLPVFFLVTGFLELAAMFLIVALVGNYFSIVLPYRLSAGTMKPSKPPALNVVCIMLGQFLFPLLLIPFLLASVLSLIAENAIGWPVGLVNVVLALIILAVVVFLYRLSLVRLGELLEEREQKILLVVSQETE